MIALADVISDLAVWGPQSKAPALSVVEAEKYCRDLATSHYENFTVVSWFLPRELRQHMYNVYAFCRWADDLGDETGDTARSTELLAWWRGELDRCFHGQASHPVFVALRSTIERFQLDQQPFADLISAFEQDQRLTEYETFDQLRDYCRRSADPVGRLVLKLFEQSTPQHVEWSDSICTGLQLANFWQDVDRDLTKRRIYLPREDRQRFGYSDDDLHARRTTPAFLDLMKFEVDRAREFLVAGQPLLRSVRGRRLRLDLELFLAGGLKILEEIESIGYRVWDRRPTVTKAAKVGLLIRAMGRAIRP
ncbi:All-trans-phytoene synthase [Caulifigura coniformis]|uniref:All-trans-phytoene synthase n=1 Tax=Caulifigura coniformis TaxID=2527983 RepID=A0A517S8F3_9PLAN|nr:squalene synthase HpnC [Caulifigura coniformis]QDT52405.1 All-trans-phytoene synthase [Caulifigura coniformis]